MSRVPVTHGVPRGLRWLQPPTPFSYLMQEQPAPPTPGLPLGCSWVLNVPPPRGTVTTLCWGLCVPLHSHSAPHPRVTPRLPGGHWLSPTLRPLGSSRKEQGLGFQGAGVETPPQHLGGTSPSGLLPQNLFGAINSLFFNTKISESGYFVPSEDTAKLGRGQGGRPARGGLSPAPPPHLPGGCN